MMFKLFKIYCLAFWCCIKLDPNFTYAFKKNTGNQLSYFKCANDLLKAIQRCSYSAAVSWKLIAMSGQLVSHKNGCCALWYFQECFFKTLQNKCSTDFKKEYLYYLKVNTNGLKENFKYCKNFQNLSQCNAKKISKRSKLGDELLKNSKIKMRFL